MIWDVVKEADEKINPGYEEDRALREASGLHATGADTVRDASNILGPVMGEVVEMQLLGKILGQIYGKHKAKGKIVEATKERLSRHPENAAVDHVELNKEVATSMLKGHPIRAAKTAKRGVSSKAINETEARMEEVKKDFEALSNPTSKEAIERLGKERAEAASKLILGEDALAQWSWIAPKLREPGRSFQVAMSKANKLNKLNKERLELLSKYGLGKEWENYWLQTHLNDIDKTADYINRGIALGTAVGAGAGIEKAKEGMKEDEDFGKSGKGRWWDILNREAFNESKRKHDVYKRIDDINVDQLRTIYDAYFESPLLRGFSTDDDLKAEYKLLTDRLDEAWAAENEKFNKEVEGLPEDEIFKRLVDSSETLSPEVVQAQKDLLYFLLSDRVQKTAMKENQDALQSVYDEAVQSLKPARPNTVGEY